jgi:hypothetical protein
MGQPEKRIKCGSCEAAIFENQIKSKDRTVKLKKVAILKRYKSSEGEWKSTHSLDKNEIPKMILALFKAYEYLIMGEKNDSEQLQNQL